MIHGPEAISTYQVFKDFAGPIATIIASGTAAWITWRFGSQQLSNTEQQTLIARQQANTALDQLRYNVFEKRYAIYADVRDFIKFMVNKPEGEIFRPEEIIPHYIVMNEARFFCSDELCSWFDELQSHCQNFIGAHASREPKEVAAKLLPLINHAAELPKRFEKELKLTQLTRPSDAQ